MFPKMWLQKTNVRAVQTYLLYVCLVSTIEKLLLRSSNTLFARQKTSNQ